MTLPRRSILDHELTKLSDDILRLTSMVDSALDRAMSALNSRDLSLAQEVIIGDVEINVLRYEVEEECLRILATQQPAATDLRRVIAAIHLAVELERIGDHASGIARVVARLETEDEIDTLHKLPKMAKRAHDMLSQVIDAYVNDDPSLARSVMSLDDKIDKQYNKLFKETVKEMQDDDYIRRATYLLWVGHNLERIGDRATNIAERVIFMSTGEFIELVSLRDDDDDDDDDDEENGDFASMN
jgi:phosphate transport system protein